MQLVTSHGSMLPCRVEKYAAAAEINTYIVYDAMYGPVRKVGMLPTLMFVCVTLGPCVRR